ncbi:MAG: hypothetical protein RLZZ81_12 [Pseudomonadota bacterium]|jgi:ankyrin repeat protein
MFEELKELFVELTKEKHSCSREEILEVINSECTNCTVEEIIILAARNGFLPIVEHFFRNGGNLHFVINEGGEKLNLLNVAAEGDALNVINYLLDNNIFITDQRALENSRTPFHSAVEWNNIEAAKLLLKRGADMNTEFKYGIVKTALRDILNIVCDADDIELNYIEMAKFLVRHGVQMPDNIDILCDDSLIQRYPTKGTIKDLLLSIKKLENLQGNDFVNAYTTSSSEVQEIWDVRISRDHLGKLAGFIEKKFSKESAIGYKEYAALREYSSLTKHKKEVLEIILAQKNFNSDDLIKVDNYIKAHFFKIALIGPNLVGSAFEAIAKAEIIGEITQYLHFEDSSIKIAGASLDDIDCNHS